MNCTNRNRAHEQFLLESINGVVLVLVHTKSDGSSCVKRGKRNLKLEIQVLHLCTPDHCVKWAVIVWKKYKNWRTQASDPAVGQEVSGAVRTSFEAYWGLNPTFPKMLLNNPQKRLIKVLGLVQTVLPVCLLNVTILTDGYQNLLTAVDIFRKLSNSILLSIH